MKKLILYFSYIGIGFLLTYTIYSCKRSDSETFATDQAILNINLAGLEFISDNQITASNEKDIPSKYLSIHPISSSLSFKSELTPITKVNKKKLGTNAKDASIRELGNKIKYTLLVYGNDGNLVTSKNFIYGEENEDTAVPLFSNTVYTFVVVSLRSESEVPEIINVNKLDNAEIKEANADLLYYSTKTKLNKGNNYLSAKLTPLFSEITTTINMDPNMTGTITKLENVSFNPISTHVSLKLKDGKATYGSTAAYGKEVAFPIIETSGKRTIQATVPTTLLHSNTSTGELIIGTLEADETLKHNVTITGLNINPGHRYNLILTLQTCTKNVSDLSGLNWEYPMVKENGQIGITFNEKFTPNATAIEFSFKESGADYGFVYDITQLDNAFNMSVNGQPIFGTSIHDADIQFQSNAVLSAQNIEFEDGSQYEGTDTETGKYISAIYLKRGNATNPIVKVVISRHGEVLIYGSKTNGGPLYPLRLKNNQKFNKVTWLGGDSTNHIKATSRVDGRTVMFSTGSGKAKIPCNN